MATTASLIIINGVDGYRTGIGLALKTIRHKLKKNCHYEKFVEFLNGSDGFVVFFFFFKFGPILRGLGPFGAILVQFLEGYNFRYVLIKNGL